MKQVSVHSILYEAIDKTHESFLVRLKESGCELGAGFAVFDRDRNSFEFDSRLSSLISAMKIYEFDLSRVLKSGGGVVSSSL